MCINKKYYLETGIELPEDEHQSVIEAFKGDLSDPFVIRAYDIFKDQFAEVINAQSGTFLLLKFIADVTQWVREQKINDILC